LAEDRRMKEEAAEDQAEAQDEVSTWLPSAQRSAPINASALNAARSSCTRKGAHRARNSNAQTAEPL